MLVRFGTHDRTVPLIVPTFVESNLHHSSAIHVAGLFQKESQLARTSLSLFCSLQIFVRTTR
jgi:hypothetical protein